MWVIDNEFSKYMIRKKDNFKSVKKFDGSYVRFGDNAKGEVTVVRTITISVFCDFIEVYLVGEMKYNILSITQLCDNGFYVDFNAIKCTI